MQELQYREVAFAVNGCRGDQRPGDQISGLLREAAGRIAVLRSRGAPVLLRGAARLGILQLSDPLGRGDEQRLTAAEVIRGGPGRQAGDNLDGTVRQAVDAAGREYSASPTPANGKNSRER